MSKIFIVILNYKGEKDTKECLESLLSVKTESIDLSTLVVDNYPENPIKLNKKDYGKINLNVIYNKENLGFSGGMNVGIKKALKDGADYIVILNNDTLVDNDFLIPLYSVLSKNSNIGLASPKIYYASGYEFHKKRYMEEDLGKVIWYAGGHIDWNNIYGIHEGVDEVDKGQFLKNKSTQSATGCCMMIKKETLEKIGLFNENYFLYYEDADLAERAKRAGYEIYFVPNSVIRHKNAQSSGGSGSTLQDYYVTRNRIYFGLKYASIKTKLSLIKESLFLLLKGRFWQRRGVIDFYFSRMGKGSFKA